jgi:16S rRNA (uracil1498-N3)-methyltransferase
MRTSRVFIEAELDAGRTIDLDIRASRYISQVLRLRANQQLTLFNGDGRDWSATIMQCQKKGCTARVDALLATESPPALAIHLGIGISRGERMDYAIQKSIELGAQTITPLHTERGIVQFDDDRRLKRLMHWRGVAVSACEQSGRSIVPQITSTSTLPDWLQQHPGGILLHHQATAVMSDLADPGTEVALLVGPEGGLSEPERHLAQACGFHAVKLGPRVMRTETAPVAALAVIQVLWGDYRQR